MTLSSLTNSFLLNETGRESDARPLNSRELMKTEDRRCSTELIARNREIPDTEVAQLSEKVTIYTGIRSDKNQRWKKNRFLFAQEWTRRPYPCFHSTWFSTHVSHRAEPPLEMCARGRTMREAMRFIETSLVKSIGLMMMIFMIFLRWVASYNDLSVSLAQRNKQSSETISKLWTTLAHASWLSVLIIHM